MPWFGPLLEWGLRLFGVFWVVGGVLTLRQARLARLMDDLLDALGPGREDRLVWRFLIVGGVLTVLSGVGLALLSRWALLPLCLLVVSQLVYFALQADRLERATSEEERQEATVAPSTRNALLLSVTVTMTAVLGWALEVL